MSEEEELLEIAKMAREKGDHARAKAALLKIESLGKKKDFSFRDMARPLELSGRYALEGLSDIAGIVTNPISEVLNLIPGVEVQRTSEAVQGLLSDVAKPETDAEKLVGQASRFGYGSMPFVKAGNLLSKGFNEVSRGVGGVLQSQPGMQAQVAASAGAGGELARQEGLNQWGQFGASLLAGLTPVGMRYIAQKAGSLVPEKDISLMLENEKIDISGLTKNSINKINQKISDALKVGELDSAALRRLVDFERTGATPTQASLTLDPATVTQQRNLAKMGVNSDNPGLQQLGQIENQNNRTLLGNLDDLAGGQAYDSYTGGQAAIKPVAEKQAGLLKAQGELYGQARDSTGRAAPLERAQFVNMVDDLLVKENKSASLPATVREEINNISKGEITINGRKHDVPFDVNTIDQLKTLIAGAYGSDGNANRALSLVRKALDKTQLQGGASDEAMAAFDAARKATFELKTWEKSTPAIKAIAKGTTPDNFMDKYIIGKGAPYSDVKKLAKEIKADPTSFEAVKNQIMAWIKEQSTSGKADEIAILGSSAMNRALKKIGDRKLSLFFSPDEISLIKSNQRVASYEQFYPPGSAVNTSNSAAMLQGGLVNWMGNTGRAIAPPVSNYLNARDAGKALDPGLLRQIEKSSGRSLLLPLGVGSSGSFE